MPAAGYELRTLRVMPLPRRRPAASGGAVLIDAAAVARRCGSSASCAPGAVLGAGGLRRRARWGSPRCSRRVPLVLTEADSHLGLTNRLLAPFARRVCLAFPIAGRSGRRYLVTGRPVPPPRPTGTAARERFGIGADETVRARVRRLAGRALDQPRGGRGVRRRAVPRAPRGGRARPAAELEAPGPHYDLRGYIAGFGEALLASDLVVARAGGSIFEIAAYGRPAVLIPYPYATADHQTRTPASWSAPAPRS